MNTGYFDDSDVPPALLEHELDPNDRRAYIIACSTYPAIYGDSRKHVKLTHADVEAQLGSLVGLPVDNHHCDHAIVGEVVAAASDDKGRIWVKQAIENTARGRQTLDAVRKGHIWGVSWRMQGTQEVHPKDGLVISQKRLTRLSLTDNPEFKDDARIHYVSDDHARTKELRRLFNIKMKIDRLLGGASATNAEKLKSADGDAATSARAVSAAMSSEKRTAPESADATDQQATKKQSLETSIDPTPAQQLQPVTPATAMSTNALDPDAEQFAAFVRFKQQRELIQEQEKKQEQERREQEAQKRMLEQQQAQINAAVEKALADQRAQLEAQFAGSRAAPTGADLSKSAAATATQAVDAVSQQNAAEGKAALSAEERANLRAQITKEVLEGLKNEITQTSHAIGSAVVAPSDTDMDVDDKAEAKAEAKAKASAKAKAATPAKAAAAAAKTKSPFAGAAPSEPFMKELEEKGSHETFANNGVTAQRLADEIRQEGTNLKQMRDAYSELQRGWDKTRRDDAQALLEKLEKELAAKSETLTKLVYDSEVAWRDTHGLSMNDHQLSKYTEASSKGILDEASLNELGNAMMWVTESSASERLSHEAREVDFQKLRADYERVTAEKALLETERSARNDIAAHDPKLRGMAALNKDTLNSLNAKKMNSGKPATAQETGAAAAAASSSSGSTQLYGFTETGHRNDFARENGIEWDVRDRNAPPPTGPGVFRQAPPMTTLASAQTSAGFKGGEIKAVRPMSHGWQAKGWDPDMQRAYLRVREEAKSSGGVHLFGDLLVRHGRADSTYTPPSSHAMRSTIDGFVAIGEPGAIALPQPMPM